MDNGLEQLVDVWLKENGLGFRVGIRHGDLTLYCIGEHGLHLMRYKRRPSHYFNVCDPQSLDKLYRILSFEEERIRGRENRKSWRRKWRNQRVKKEVIK